MKTKVLSVFFVLLTFLSCSGNGAKDVISASGTIEAIEVNVASKVAGELQERTVDEGARVRAGDKLAVVDHANLDIQLRQAESGVDLSRAQLLLLRNGARKEDIQQAEAALQQAEASLTVAGDDARRMRELVKTGSVTLKQKEDAEARLTVAEAQRSAAAEALKKIRTLARPEEIQAAEARLAQAQAAVDLLKKTIADCTIAAPVGGIVTHKAVEAGELVTQGATIVTISELDSVYVMIYVTEKELGRVRLGEPADVKIDAFPGRAFAGKITYISPEAEFTPKNVQTKEDRVKLVFGVKVEIENKEGLLKPGLPADATIRVSPSAKVTGPKTS
jgi:HlyD family secretion protein